MTIRRRFTKFMPAALAVAIGGCMGEGLETESEHRAVVAQQQGLIAGYVLDAKHALSDMSSARVAQEPSGAISSENAKARHVARPNGWASSYAKNSFGLDHDPFPGSLQDHNQAVRAFFLRLGLPEGQIGAVGGTPMQWSEASQDDGTGGKATPPRVVGYTSSVQRKLDGIVVLDSVALAWLDALGEPASLSVYWPALPKTVVAEAVALRDRLAKPGALEDYARKIGIDLSDREWRVVVRHTGASDRAPFEAHAVVDVIGIGSQPEQHFDADGRRILLPSERPRERTQPEDVATDWQARSECALDGDFQLPGAADAAIHIDRTGRWAFARGASRMEGRIERTADGIAISDDAKSSETACADGVAGQYRMLFREGCSAMRLALVADACERRARTLDGLILSRRASVPELGTDGALQR